MQVSLSSLQCALGSIQTNFRAAKSNSHSSSDPESFAFEFSRSIKNNFLWSLTTIYYGCRPASPNDSTIRSLGYQGRSFDLWSQRWLEYLAICPNANSHGCLWRYEGSPRRLKRHQQRSKRLYRQVLIESSCSFCVR